MSDVKETARKAKEASIKLLQLSSETKNAAIKAVADKLSASTDRILTANKIDTDKASKLVANGQMSDSMYHRLLLDPNKLYYMVEMLSDVAKLEDPVNNIIWSKEIADGMNLSKVSCPIGVIGVIFEARPDVITQIVSLAVKSSNALILKGGAEADNTNKVLTDIISEALAEIPGYPKNTVNVLYSRDDVKEMLDADEYIDLIIPRGSNALVKYIKENTKIPVLGHSDGVCHIFIDEYAGEEKVIPVCFDAKCHYPAACNSVETILVHKNISDKVIPELLTKFYNNSVKVNSTVELKAQYPEYISDIVEDWHTEYSDKIVSLKIVNDIDEAIEHINTFGSGHTDCIITEDDANAEKFMTFVDSAGVYKNVSTRFADGYRYGFGSEVGISTNKIHARGPVGLEGLTIYKYKLTGNGDVVSDFTTGRRSFYK